MPDNSDYAMSHIQESTNRILVTKKYVPIYYYSRHLRSKSCVQGSWPESEAVILHKPTSAEKAKTIVAQRLDELANYEAEIVSKGPIRPAIH